MLNHELQNTNNYFAANKNNNFVIILFVITILFQTTGLKIIWSLETVSRIVNSLVFVILIVYSIRVVKTADYSKKVWNYYFLPGILIVCGLILNISINSLSNITLINTLGTTFPWLIYLIIPSLMNKKVINSNTLWRYYFYFMLWSNIFGILDYIVMLYWGPIFRVVYSSNGPMYGGSFSMLLRLEDGTAYSRYYSCFNEPGTFAMFLLPAISYAVFHKKLFSLVLFLIVLYLTESLGGAISLLVLINIIVFVRLNRKNKYILNAMLASSIMISVLWFIFSGTISTRYEKKDRSALIREENFTNTFYNLPALLINNPIGMKLAVDTESFQENKFYYGSNFIPGTYIQYGGISAFIGYCICLIVSFIIAFKNIFRNDLSLEEKVVFSSILVLIPFIFQRSTIWESSLFAFLFAPSIIRILQKDNHFQLYRKL